MIFCLGPMCGSMTSRSRPAVAMSISPRTWMTVASSVPGGVSAQARQRGDSFKLSHYLGVSIREYRELEAGARSPSFETWDRICKLFGWPQTFVK
jgi:hypothetical protein